MLDDHAAGEFTKQHIRHAAANVGTPARESECPSASNAHNAWIHLIACPLLSCAMYICSLPYYLNADMVDVLWRRFHAAREDFLDSYDPL